MRTYDLIAGDDMVCPAHGFRGFFQFWAVANLSVVFAMRLGFLPIRQARCCKREHSASAKNDPISHPYTDR